MFIQRYLYTSWYLYLSQIFRRSLQNLYSYRGTLRYYKVYTYTIGLILILQRLHSFGGTRRYYRDITERILVLRNLFLYGSTGKYYLFKCPKRCTLVLISNLSYTHTVVPVGTTEFILIRSLYGGTRRYYITHTYSCISDLILVLRNIYLSYGTYTCVTELILVFRIRKYP